MTQYISTTDSIERRFDSYIVELSSTLAHADRAGPFREYTMGLLLPGERKSIEPIATRINPARVGAEHQRLHHFVTQGEWSDEHLLQAVSAYVVPHMEQEEAIRAWIVDDSGIPKKGRHSVGVERQYCGQLGKQENCQVAVSVSLANHEASIPAAFRLYLPKSWAEDRERRKKAHVPDSLEFQTKPRIALEQLKALKEHNVSEGVVLADAAYGSDSAFREGLRELGLTYAVGIQSATAFFLPNEVPPLIHSEPGKNGRPRKLLRPAADTPSRSALEFACALPSDAFQTVIWREGAEGRKLRGRFARVRVVEAHRYYWKSELPAEEWLLIEWPEGEAHPSKYTLSNLPIEMDLKDMVDLVHLRWRVERDYQELKQEIGLGHFEGRSWRGFHHHGALSIAAYGFLVAGRCAFPPCREGKHPDFSLPPIPAGFIPRGSAVTT